MTGTALITGASAGLGVEFAKQLAARGYDLALVARRANKLAEVAAELSATHGVAITTIAADLTEPAAPEQIRQQLAGTEVSFLVNNAGVAGPHLLDERDWRQQQAFFQLMMTSVAQLCHLFIPQMVERGFGRVINVSSMGARIARAGDYNYGPAKAYVVALSEALAISLKDRGVKVSALCPGFTRTDFHAAAGTLEFKESLPKFLWYDADVVVREGLGALERDKPVFASGRLYRWVDPIMQSVFTRPLLRGRFKSSVVD